MVFFVKGSRSCAIVVAVWFPSSLCPYGYAADPNTFSFPRDEESHCSSLFTSSAFLQTHPQTLWPYLWPSTFWAILPYMWSSIPAPSPTSTLYGKGAWGVSVNGTWLKKCIYIRCLLLHMNLHLWDLVPRGVAWIFCDCCCNVCME